MGAQIHTDENSPENYSPERTKRITIFLHPRVGVSFDHGSGGELLCIFLFSQLGQYKPVLDTTASLQNVWIVCVVVAFAYNLCTAQFELSWQRSLTSPLDIFSIILGTRVATAHDIHIIEAFRIATNAC